MAQPPLSVRDLLSALEDRAYKSYKSRLNTHLRVQARSRAWNTALVSLATATTIAALGLLVDNEMYGESGETLLAACSVLGLAASLVVAAVDYPGRAVRIETNYKDIQDVSSRIQAAGSLDASPTLDIHGVLYKEYDALIRQSENHSDADWHRVEGKKTWARALSAAVTMIPYLTLALPAWIVWQFATWVANGAS